MIGPYMFFCFSNDDAKICNDCESKNQAIENLENEVMEMKMKLEVQGLFYDFFREIDLFFTIFFLHIFRSVFWSQWSNFDQMD